MTQRRVTIIYKTLPAYRLEFFDGLRSSLAADDIQLDLVYGNAVGQDRAKGDARSLPWAKFRQNRTININGRNLIWQPSLDVIRGSDLVIVEQASKLVINYLLLAGSISRIGPKVALWGHGANLQRHTASRLSETIKRHYSRLPHWWFSYTESTKQIVSGLGFPSERITVVQNAIDTRGLRSSIASLTSGEVNAYTRSFGGTRGHIGLFLGSLYDDKRLEFLIEAAEVAHVADPAFALLIAGDGPDRDLVSRAADRHTFIHWLGRVDGRERALALAASNVMLMPGLVGLAILDSFAGEAPLITTAIDFHSPEIEYLRQSVNGKCLPADIDAKGYGNYVAEILAAPQALEKLVVGCRESADIYTIEAMTERFRTGIITAMET